MVRYEGEILAPTHIVSEIFHSWIARGERRRAERLAKSLSEVLISRMDDESSREHLLIPVRDHQIEIELTLPDDASEFKHPGTRRTDIQTLPISLKVTSFEQGMGHTKVVFYPNTSGFEQYWENLANVAALRVTRDLSTRNRYHVYGPDDKPGIIFDAELRSRVFGHAANLLVEASEAVVHMK